MVAGQINWGFFLSTASSFIPILNSFVFGVEGSFLKQPSGDLSAPVKVFCRNDGHNVGFLQKPLMIQKSTVVNHRYLKNLKRLLLNDYIMDDKVLFKSKINCGQPRPKHQHSNCDKFDFDLHQPQSFDLDFQITIHVGSL